MSEIFKSYEREFSELTATIAKKLAVLTTAQGEQRKEKFGETQQELEEAKYLVKQMELEARSVPAQMREPLLGKIKAYEEEIQRLRREAKNSANQAAEAARASLMESGYGGDLDSGTADQRTRLLQTTDRISRTGDRIKESKKVLLETEDLGISILQDLNRQRQVIEHARDTLHSTDDNITRSRQILGSMTRRMMANKIIVIGVIVVLVICIILLIWVKMRR